MRSWEGDPARLVDESFASIHITPTPTRLGRGLSRLHKGMDRARTVIWGQASGADPSKRTSHPQPHNLLFTAHGWAQVPWGSPQMGETWATLPTLLLPVKSELSAQKAVAWQVALGPMPVRGQTQQGLCFLLPRQGPRRDAQLEGSKAGLREREHSFQSVPHRPQA